MHYSLNYYERTAAVDMSQNCKFFLSYIKGTKILDLGCGSGRDSNYFTNLGFQVTSVDPNPVAAAYAVSKFNIKVEPLVPTDLQVNGVWACACFIHLPLNELLTSLSDLQSHLNSQAIIYLSLKYGVGSFEADQQIYYRYDERLTPEIENLGYEVVTMRKSADGLQRDNDWIEYIIRNR